MIMKVPLDTGGPVSGAWSETATPEEINLTPPAGYEARFTRPVEARLDVRRVGEEFFLEGEVQTAVTYTCVRCLGEFDGQVSADLSLIIHRVTAPSAHSGELEAYVEVPLGTPEYDVGPYAREALLLAVPLTPHCRDDCRGICAHCGADLNRESCRCGEKEPDPRWEALKSIASTERS
jgi:uncharacterized protein